MPRPLGRRPAGSVDLQELVARLSPDQAVPRRIRGDEDGLRALQLAGVDASAMGCRRPGPPEDVVAELISGESRVETVRFDGHALVGEEKALAFDFVDRLRRVEGLAGELFSGGGESQGKECSSWRLHERLPRPSRAAISTRRAANPSYAARAQRSPRRRKMNVTSVLAESPSVARKTCARARKTSGAGV